MNSSKETPFFKAISCNYHNFVQPLVQHKANVHYGNGWITPFGLTVANAYYEKGQNNKQEAIINTIKILYKAGALPISVDNYDNTVFHKAIDKRVKVIQTLITHINFKNNDEGITNTIKTVLLVFNRLGESGLPKIHREIQIFILSKLLSLNCFHKGLYKQCEGKQHYPLRLQILCQHIQYLQEVLQIKNKKNKTALESLLKEKTEYMRGYKSTRELLLDGTTLQKDLDILHEKYPDLSAVPENNLARQILENHYAFEKL